MASTRTDTLAVVILGLVTISAVWLLLPLPMDSLRGHSSANALVRWAVTAVALIATVA